MSIMLLSNPNLQKQAKAFGSEVAIATVYTGVSCLFSLNRTARVLLVSNAVFSLSINFICRGLKVWVDETKDCELSEMSKSLLQIVGFVLNTICGTQLASIDQCTRNVLVHEGGHALAGMAVFTNVCPKVRLRGNDTGFTEMIPRNPCEPILGFKGSEFLYSAGGPLASLCSTVVMIALAHFWGDAYDGFDAYLYEATALTVIQHITYASTSGSSDHDFVSMAKAGMPAWIWMALFALVPLATMLLLVVYDKTIRGDRATLPDGERAGEEVVVDV